MAEPEEKSELELLLEKNASDSGLAKFEFHKAFRLIQDPVYSEEKCRLCKECNKENKAIYDTGLCQDHAFYALATKESSLLRY